MAGVAGVAGVERLLVSGGEWLLPVSRDLCESQGGCGGQVELGVDKCVSDGL